MDFLHIGDCDHVPWATDECETEFSSVTNLSNYGKIFIIFEFLLHISEMNVVILFIFGIFIRHHEFRISVQMNLL